MQEGKGPASMEESGASQGASHAGPPTQQLVLSIIALVHWKGEEASSLPELYYKGNTVFSSEFLLKFGKAQFSVLALLATP